MWVLAAQCPDVVSNVPERSTPHLRRTDAGREDVRDRPARDRFDAVVRVGERPAEPLREQPPDGGFADAAVADEDDVVGHGVWPASGAA